MKKLSIVVLVMGFVSLALFSTTALASEEGCTPGFWKNHYYLDENNYKNSDPGEFWCPDYSPTDSFYDVFGLAQFGTKEDVIGWDKNGDDSLLSALKTGGGGEKALARHAVAALLNACYDDFNSGFYYEFKRFWVIERVKFAYEMGNFETWKDDFVDANERNCTL